MLDLGIRLFLLIGETVPTPAPISVIDAIDSIEVTNKDQERDGFQLDLRLGKGTLSEYGLLKEGILDPPSRVIIMVTLGVLPQVLIDGIITNHQVVPSNEAGRARLRVIGEDISVKLDLDDRNETHPNLSDSSIVEKLLSNYTIYGLIPNVTRTVDVPLETDRVPSQQVTDLAFIRELAERNGFVFYIEPTSVPDVNIAYWGPENRRDRPQPPLSMNMGPETNVDQPIVFAYRPLESSTPQVTIVEPITKTNVSVPPPSEVMPALTSQPTRPMRKTIARDTAHLSLSQAMLRALSMATQSADTVTATGELDAVRYGGILQSRRLVGVRGVGKSYDGEYYVKEVRHQIKRGEYKQSFTLVRDGLGASSSQVVT